MLPRAFGEVRQCFDTAGELHLQSRIESNFGSSIHGDAFAEYAARNLGYISLSQSKSHVRIWLRPLRTSDIALTQLLYWLASVRPERVAIAEFEDGWATKIVSHYHAIRIFCEMAADLDSRRTAYTRQTWSEQVSEPALQSLISFWASLSGTYCESRYVELSKTHLGDRIFVVQETNDNLVFGYVGDNIGRRTLGGSLRCGLPVEQLPDQTYARQTVASYRAALAKSPGPSIERVRAKVRPTRQAEARIDYLRALLPCINEFGQSVLVGTSIMLPVTHDGIEVG